MPPSAWTNDLDGAIKEQASSGKPIMVLVHKVRRHARLLRPLFPAYLADATTATDTLVHPSPFLRDPRPRQSWCGACKNLKTQFTPGTDIVAASAKFIMVNLEDDAEPKDASYSPDGGYIPRILFVKDGKVVPEANSGNDQYKYFYSQAVDIVNKMESFAAGDWPSKEEL